jgi:hypothetical protein
VASAILRPEKIGKKGKLMAARKESVKVIYKKDGDVLKIITFYPVKQFRPTALSLREVPHLRDDAACLPVGRQSHER